jgi:hypothetical protein
VPEDPEPPWLPPDEPRRRRPRRDPQAWPTRADTIILIVAGIVVLIPFAFVLFVWIVCSQTPY